MQVKFISIENQVGGCKGYPGWKNGEIKELGSDHATYLISHFPKSFQIVESPEPRETKEKEIGDSDKVMDRAIPKKRKYRRRNR